MRIFHWKLKFIFHPVKKETKPSKKIRNERNNNLVTVLYSRNTSNYALKKGELNF